MRLWEERISNGAKWIVCPDGPFVEASEHVTDSVTSCDLSFWRYYRQVLPGGASTEYKTASPASAAVVIVCNYT